MPFIWAIMICLVSAFTFKNIFTAILFTIFIGPMIYSKFNKIAPAKQKQTQKNESLFLMVTFEVLGHLSKSKGQVTQKDISMATDIMDKLRLDHDKRLLAQHSFNQGKRHDYPIDERLDELYQQYKYRQDILKFFCEHLMLAAISDGSLHEKEEQILYKIAKAFNIPASQMSMFIEMMMASYHFQNGGAYQQYQNHQGHANHQAYRQSDIENAYRVLGIDSSADNMAIKRAYRKLMNEHHPDKLASKGLPEEMLETAKKRAQEIQSAYDMIKSQRGFK